MDSVSTLKETPGGEIEAPESRIGCAADARNIIAVLQRAEVTRSQRRAKINGLLNGNRPWSQTMLTNKGQGERTNLNLREAEGFVAAAKTPYYDLESEVDRYAQFTLDYGNEPAREQEWADKIGTRYHYALDDWGGRELVVQRSQYQMIVHGVGPRVWEDSRDWRSKSRMAGQILVPDDASADVEEWETAAIPRSYLPSELWDKIKNESAATAAKWNVPAVKRAIMQAAPEDLQRVYGLTWEHYEAEIRKGSFGYNSRSKRIFVTALFQKEFDQKVSHFIVLESTSQTALNETTTVQPPADPEMGFLFRKIGRFECFTQIVNPFLYDVGPDGQWHSVKGAGPKIFDFCEVSNRLTCRMIDGAVASSGLLLQAKDGNALQQTAISHIAGAVVLHPDYKVEQHRLGDNLQSPLLVKRDLRNTMDGNTGQYRRRVADETPYPTLGQEQMDASQQAVLSKGDVNRYYRSLDKWHTETFRRLLEMGESLYERRENVAPTDDYEKDEKGLSPSERGALKFYRGCIEDGVPEEVLKFKNFCRIKATRSVGHGSAQMRLMIGDKLMSLLPTMDERGRNAALRMEASALGGQNLADALYPRYDTPILADDQMWQASIENGMLRDQTDALPLLTPTQDAVVHCQSHMNDVGAHAQQVQAGQGDPMALLQHLNKAGVHTQKHLMTIAGDETRKAQYEELSEKWLEMSAMADQLRQQLEEAAAAAEKNQPVQGPDPDLIAKMAKVNGELGIKKMKAMGDLQLKAEKQKATMQMKNVTTAHDIRLANFEAVAKPRAA